MTALVIGYGSIGQRHARLLKDLGQDVAIVSRRSVNFPKVFDQLERALGDCDPDYIVVASRTNEHLGDIEKLTKLGFKGTILAEKPLFNSPHPLPENSFKGIHVAFNLRFHPVIRALRSTLEGRSIYAAHAYVGQYLPDWRPGTEYSKHYSAIRNQGGGVLRDLSHELDYLTWILGGWSNLTASGGQFSSLDIDSDDVFSLLLSTPKCPVVTINMNYLDSQLRRQIHVLTDQGTVHADIVAGTLSVSGDLSEFEHQRDDTYIAEHLAILEGKDQDILCSFEEGLDIVKLISTAEKAAMAKQWLDREGNPV